MPCARTPTSARPHSYYPYPDPSTADPAYLPDPYSAHALKQEEQPDALSALTTPVEEVSYYSLDPTPGLDAEPADRDLEYAEDTQQQQASSSTGRRSGRNGYRKPAVRQQFTACGACRVRRVKCDLKDMPRPNNEEQPQCSNCKLRHLRCVDEYGKKPAKALRRGKRLIEVERMYGYKAGETSGSGSPVTESGMELLPHSSIPPLEPTFFSSAFFRMFYLQRPILDESEFASLLGPFTSHPHATHPSLLGGDVADLLGKTLAIWAISYGVDAAGHLVSRSRDDIPVRLQRCVLMVQEVVRALDARGVLRRVGWDTARLLFLLLPLTHEIMDESNRRHLYRTAFLQVQELCAADGGVMKGAPMDARHFLKLRVLWYAMMFEGTKIALHGGQLVLDEDTWADRLPLSAPSLPSKIPPHPPSPSPSALTPHSHLATVWRYALPPTNVSLACRMVHKYLTCPRARAAQDVDEGLIGRVWEVLAGCWDEFERLKVRRGGNNTPQAQEERDGHQRSPNMLSGDETEMYCCRWQIFLVECYAIIRGALVARISALNASPALRPSSSSSSSADTNSAESDKLHRLLAGADSRCFDAARGVAHVLPWLVGNGFFSHDATLVCDGIFYTARILAMQSQQDEQAQTAVEKCVEALRQMHWCYGHSVQRERELFEVLKETPWMAYQQQHAHAQSYGSGSSSGEGSGTWHGYSQQQHPQDTYLDEPSPVYSLTPSYDLPPTGASVQLTAFQSLRSSTSRPGLNPLQMPHHIGPVSVSAQTSMSPLSPQQVYDLSTSHPLSPDSLAAQGTFAFAGPPYLDAASASPTTVYSSRPPSAHQAEAAYPGVGYTSGIPSFTTFTASASAAQHSQGRMTHVYRQELDALPKPGSRYEGYGEYVYPHSQVQMDILPPGLQEPFGADLAYPFVFGATF